MTLILSGGAVGTVFFKADELAATFSLMCLACIALIFYTIKKSDRLQMPAYISSWSLVFILVLIGSWAAYFDSGQVSDFGVYYRCGISSHVNLQEWFESCQSAYLMKNSTYWVRSYFYSSAIGQIIGGAYSTFKVVNALLHMITIVVWFYGVRAYYGVRIAWLSALLLALYPEYWFTTTLVTTDNFAVLCVVLFVLVAPRLRGALPIALACSLALGVIVFLGHQLRSMGSIFVLSLAFYLICAGVTKKNYTTLVFGLIAVSIFALLSKLFLWANPSGLPDLFSPVKIVSAIDFHTNQDFGVNYQWGEHFWPATPSSMQLPMAFYKLSTEFAGGFSEWPMYLFNKAAIVFSGTGYYGLSAFPYPPDNPDSLVTDTLSNIPFSTQVFPWLNFIVLMYLMASVTGVLRAKIMSGAALISLLVVGAFGLLVLGMGESQARYSAIIAPALSLLAALGFFSADTKAVGLENVVPIWKQYLGGVLIIAAVYLLILIVAMALPTSEHSNANVRLIERHDSAFGHCSTEGVNILADYKKVRVVFAGTNDCAALDMGVAADKKSVSFYLSGSRFPFRFEGVGVNKLAYKLIAKDQLVASGEIGEKSVSLVNAELSQGSKGEVVLLLKRLNSGEGDFIDISLLH
jgi:hypothetical protein